MRNYSNTCTSPTPSCISLCVAFPTRWLLVFRITVEIRAYSRKLWKHAYRKRFPAISHLAIVPSWEYTRTFATRKSKRLPYYTFGGEIRITARSWRSKTNTAAVNKRRYYFVHLINTRVIGTLTTCRDNCISEIAHVDSLEPHSRII